jgi:DinB superfamily
VIGPPDRTEAAEYYFRYIDRVRGTDICRVLAEQRDEMSELLEGISEEQSLFRYAPDKWSIREVVAHVNDGERLFVGRAWWFARGFDSPLPSFDQDVAAAHAGADDRKWQDHIEEFLAIRAATVCFFSGLDAAAWKRAGTASDMHMTVRALAYITVGHMSHHTAILRERYLNR